MKLIPHDPYLAGAPLGQLRSPEEEAPNFPTAVAAGFRQENDLINLARWTFRPGFAPDPAFSLNDALKDDPLRGQYGDVLGRAQSREEFDYLRGQVVQELRDKEILASSGWKGFVAAGLAGVVSPTSLIPMIGPARGLKGAAQSFALAGAAVTAQEAVLFGTQSARTVEESLIGIAGGTVLGGLLGTAARQLAPEELVRVGNDMASSPGKLAILNTDPVTGATTRLEVDTIVRGLDEYSGELSVMHGYNAPLVARVEGEVPSLRMPGYVKGFTEEYSGPRGSTPFGMKGVVYFDGDGKWVSGKVPGFTPSEAVSARVTFDRALVITPENLDKVVGAAKKALEKDEVNPTELTRFAKKEGYDGLIINGMDDLRKSLNDDPVALSARAEAAGLTPSRADAALRDQVVSFNPKNIKVGDLVADLQSPSIVPTSKQIAGKTTADEYLDSLENLVARESVGVGAARVPVKDATLFKPGKVRGKLIDILARLNPVTRSLNHPYLKSLRYHMAQLQVPGVRLANAEEVVEAGAAFDRANVHIGRVGEFVMAYDDAYARYIAGNDLPDEAYRSAFIATIKSNLGMLPPGKMSYKEFGEVVFDYGNRGLEHSDPSVNLAIAAQKTYYDYVNDVAKRYHNERKKIDGPDANSLYDEIIFGEEAEIQQYVHHQYDTVFMEDHMDQFLGDIAAAGMERFNHAFKESHKAFLKADGKLEKLENTLQLSPKLLNERLLTDQQLIKMIEKDFELPMKQLKEYRKALKEQGVDGEEFSTAIRAFEGQFGPEYAQAMGDLKMLKADQKLLKQVGAGMDMKARELQDKIDALEELQLEELERVAQSGKALDKKLAKFSDDVLDAEGEKLWEKFSAAVEKHAKATALFEKTSPVDPAKYDARADKMLEATDRLSELLTKAKGSDQFNRQAARDALKAIQAEYLVKKKNLNASRAVRENELKKKLKETDPAVLAADRANELVFVKTQRAALEEGFYQQWTKRGGDNIDTREGTADFARQAREDAKILFRKITGNPNRVVGLDLLSAERGPELARTLNYVPFDVKQKYLIRNPEQVIRAHGHSVFPDLEMYRVSGSPNGARMFDDMQQEDQIIMDQIASATHMYAGKPVNIETLPEELRAKAKPLTAEKKQKLQAEYTALYKEGVEDLRTVIDRFRHQRGIPQNGNSFGYRVGRMAMNMNVTRFMGSVLPSSIPDVARPVMKFGMGTVFKDAWLPLIADLDRVKMSREQGLLAGVAFDPVLHNRAQALFDTMDNHSTRQSLAERGLEFLANKTGMVALFDRWTAENKHLTNSVTFAVIDRYLRDVLDNPGSIKAKQFFLDANLSPNMVRRINEQYALPGGSNTFNGGVRLPNTEVWKDWDAVMALRAAVNKIAGDVIVTPGLDRPSWVDENMAYKLVAQFRSFSFTATNRIMMSGLQTADMAFMQGAVFSVALGALSYYTWAVSIGGSNYTKAMEFDSDEWIYEAVARSGLLGILSEGQKIGEQIPGLNDYLLFGGDGRSSRRASSLLGQVFGPSFDLAEKLATVAQGLNNPTASTLHSARVALVPYQNVFYLRRLLTMMEEQMVEFAGLPVRRQ